MRICALWNGLTYARKGGLEMDEERIKRIMAAYCCDREDAIRYLALRDEGYSQYQAAVMAGLRDPDY